MNKRRDKPIGIIFVLLALTLVLGMFLETKRIVADLDKIENAYFYESEEDKNVFKAYRNREEKLLQKTLDDDTKVIGKILKMKYTYSILELPEHSVINEKTKGKYFTSIYDIADSNYVIAYRSNYKICFR